MLWKCDQTLCKKEVKVGKGQHYTDPLKLAINEPYGINVLEKMSEDLLRYDLMIEAALRDVVRETIDTVARDGLPGDHHFYITFLTKFPGVKVPEYLRKQYPDEMTIVLQYQFSGLKIEDDAIQVMLSFNNIKESLVVPIDSITTFADPSVNFALQFQNVEETSEYPEKAEEAQIKGEKAKSEGGDKDDCRGKVISLDKFRKK
ncbi:MAG: ClpXP protease specificity-enhancing factor SspB [Alphaproteobacteria bacterium]|nr:ClpXP protease specificity-enhancing factor SspB [Alphaproteobacteria bacterium]